MGGSEGSDGAAFHHERLRGGNDLGLQLEDCRRRLRTDAGDTRRGGGGVVEFERLQRHRVHIGGGEHLFFGGVELLQISGADEALEQRDVRSVRRI